MSDSKSLVSVIIPTYNRAHLLSEAIQCVLNQTYEHIELILVDDASTDNTEQVIRSFFDARLKYFRHRRNRGGGAARNTGITASKGEYIAFLDSDDRWLKNKLEKQIALFNHKPKSVGVTYTGILEVNDEGKIIKKVVPQLEGDICAKMFLNNWIGSMSTAVVRRQCFNDCGLFDERMPSCQDWDLWIRIARKYHFACIKDFLVMYHKTYGDRISSDMNAKVIGHRMILKKYYKDIRKNRRYHSEQRFRIGAFYVLSGQTQQGRQEFLRAILLYPYRLRYFFHLGCALLGEKVYRLQFERAHNSFLMR